MTNYFAEHWLVDLRYLQFVEKSVHSLQVRVHALFKLFLLVGDHLLCS